MPVNDNYTKLRRGLMKYRQRWGGLPDVASPAGPAMKAGAADFGDQIFRALELLRERHRFGGYIHVKIIPGAEEAQDGDAGGEVVRGAGVHGRVGMTDRYNGRRASGRTAASSAGGVCATFSTIDTAVK